MAACSTSKPYHDIDELMNIYIKNAESLITQCQLLEIRDAKKLEKKCRSELKYLLSLRKRRKTFQEQCDLKVQEHHLQSSNLSHFAAILHAVHRLPKVKRILYPFSLQERQDSLVVDVVANDGHIWLKAVARKAQALHLIWAGKGQYGDRDIVRQAEDYIKCAKEHPVNFVVPEVHYAFYNEVTHPMAEALEAIGVKVWGERISVSTMVQNQVQLTDHSFEEDVSDKELEGKHFQVLEDNYLGENSGLHIPSASEFMSLSIKGNAYDISHKHFSVPETSCERQNLEEISAFHLNESSSDSKEHSFSVKSEPCDVLKHSNALSEQTITEPIRNKENQDSDSLNLISNSPDTQKADCEDLFSFILGNAPSYLFPETDHQEIGTVQSNVPEDVSKVNLDITTLITLVSSITHGGCNFVFREKILSLQAEEERNAPVLPELQNFLKDKEWYVCQTAVNDFKAILDTLGGENEKRRAKELLNKCKIVEDQPSARAQNLPQTGKIRDRSKIIFGTGDQLKCVTVSANSGFVRAAEHQGMAFAVYLHQSRALTEKKEKMAEQLVDWRLL